MVLDNCVKIFDNILMVEIFDEIDLFFDGFDLFFTDGHLFHGDKHSIVEINTFIN